MKNHFPELSCTVPEITGSEYSESDGSALAWALGLEIIPGLLPLSSSSTGSGVARPAASGASVAASPMPGVSGPAGAPPAPQQQATAKASSIDPTASVPPATAQRPAPISTLVNVIIHNLESWSRGGQLSFIRVFCSGGGRPEDEGWEEGCRRPSLLRRDERFHYGVPTLPTESCFFFQRYRARSSAELQVHVTVGK